jgi:hypothetical protein
MYLIVSIILSVFYLTCCSKVSFSLKYIVSVYVVLDFVLWSDVEYSSIVGTSNIEGVKRD